MVTQLADGRVGMYVLVSFYLNLGTICLFSQCKHCGSILTLSCFKSVEIKAVCVQTVFFCAGQSITQHQSTGGSQNGML